jgi:hypothetical protein
VFWIANEGQWPGDFQFKCEIGNSTYYVTPKGMTIDLREVSEIVAPSSLGKNPQDHPDPCNPVVILNEVKDPSERPASIRGHVIQIHYASGLPPFTGERKGGLSAGASPSAGVPAPPQSDIPPRFSGGARGGEKLPHYSNYFLGRDSSNWRSRVPHYQTVIAEAVWPGIDVEYRADKQGVETIYHVQPGADPTQIQMEYLGFDAPLIVDAQGNLVLTTSLGEVKEQAPYAYQMDGRVQRRVECSYVIYGTTIRFTLADYDRAKPLVIDPVIYGTYLGGGDTDIISDIAFGADSSIFIAGNSTSQMSTGFPVTPGAYEIVHSALWSAPFVVKLNASGDSVIWGSFINALGCNVKDLVVTSMQQPTIVTRCQSNSSNWPLTPNALDTVREDQDYGIAQFSRDGSNLLFSTYLGGSSVDIARDAVIDNNDELWICGSAYIDFPTTPDAIYPAHIGGGDAVISVVNLNTFSLDYSTYWGGQSAEGADDPYRIQLLGPGLVAICGGVYSNISLGDLPTTPDAFQGSWGGGRGEGFFAILNTAVSLTEYCTFIGGEGIDFINAVATTNGLWALTGGTDSPDFPLTDGAYDTTFHGGSADGFAILMDLPATLLSSTLLGGDNSDYPYSVLISDRFVTIAGYTRSPDFPVTHGAFDTVFNNNGLPNPYGDYFISRLNWSMTELQYSTYFGACTRKTGAMRSSRMTISFGSSERQDQLIYPQLRIR